MGLSLNNKWLQAAAVILTAGTIAPFINTIVKSKEGRALDRLTTGQSRANVKFNKSGSGDNKSDNQGYIDPSGNELVISPRPVQTAPANNYVPFNNEIISKNQNKISPGAKLLLLGGLGFIAYKLIR